MSNSVDFGSSSHEIADAPSGQVDEAGRIPAQNQCHVSGFPADVVLDVSAEARDVPADAWSIQSRFCTLKELANASLSRRVSIADSQKE